MYHVGTSLAVHSLRLHLLMQEVWVRSLTGELRSHMPLGRETRNTEQKQYCNRFNKDFIPSPPHQKTKKKKKVYHSVVFLAYSQNRITITSIESQNIFISQKRNPLAVTSHSLLPKVLSAINLISVPLNLPVPLFYSVLFRSQSYPIHTSLVKA